MSRVETSFKERDLGYVRFIPPYCPALQPIKRFCAHGNNYVARIYQLHRTMKEAWAQPRDGWYGRRKGDAFDGAPHCQKLVDHSLKEVKNYIDRDELLSGCYEDLRGGPEICKIRKQCGLVEMDEDFINEGVKDIPDKQS